MTLTLFITLVTILSLVSSLITEGIKKAFPDLKKSTLVVAILAVVIGWGGGVITYIFMGIPFNLISILSLVLLAPAIWLTATLGYDKVIEVLEQIGVLTK